MASWLSGILSDDDYLPHGLCLLWEPGLIWTHVLSDGLIAASYYSIPAALAWFAMKRRDLPFQGVFVLFVIFIVACGTTHALAAVTLWEPVYRLDGIVKALTALVSVPTAIALWFLMPAALTLPSNEQLEAANRRLSHEVEERQRIEQEVRQLNVLLEERVRSRTALLQSILDTVPDALVVIDARGHIESFSTAAQRLFGYGADEAIGRNVSMLMPSPRREEHDSYLEHYLTTGERRVIGVGRVVVGQRRDGGTFPMELSVGEVVLADQRLFAGFARDLTERYESERREHELRAEVAQISRFTEMGQMASGLAHELNQPLAATANYLYGLRRFLERGDAGSVERARATADIALGQVQRAAQIIRRLREFVKKSEPEPKPENILTLLQEVNDLIAFTARERDVLIRFGGDPEPPPVLVDKVQIQQVVANLLRNAIEAMETSTRREIVIEVAPAGENLVAVTVADTGPGISTEVADRLFQPFITTKTQGLGVGLSLCRSIIEAHRGQLWAEPNPAGGSVFRFTVPVAEMAEAFQAG